MKTLLLFVAILFLAGCQGKQQVETATIKASSMVCGKCAKTIEKAVSAVNGVKSVDVDVKTKIVQVRYVGSETNVGAIENAITGAGYDANDKKRDQAAYEKLDSCCKIDG